MNYITKDPNQAMTQNLTDDELLREYARISYENFTFDGNKNLRRDVVAFGRAIYCAGLADGRELAIEECAKVCESRIPPRYVLAGAIRALAKLEKST